MKWTRGLWDRSDYQEDLLYYWERFHISMHILLPVFLNLLWRAREETKSEQLTFLHNRRLSRERDLRRGRTPRKSPMSPWEEYYSSPIPQLLEAGKDLHLAVEGHKWQPSGNPTQLKSFNPNR